jgi:hypothetical protein
MWSYAVESPRISTKQGPKENPEPLNEKGTKKHRKIRTRQISPRKRKELPLM